MVFFELLVRKRNKRAKCRLNYKFNVKLDKIKSQQINTKKEMFPVRVAKNK